MPSPKLLVLALMPLTLLGCSRPIIEKFEGFAQGTTYHVSYWSDAPLDTKAIRVRVEQEFAVIDKLLSNYRPDSVIETFNSVENTESQAVGPEIVALVRIAQIVNLASKGCYDLTIKPLFDLWGFRGESLTIPSDSAIVSELKKVGMSKLEVADDTHLRKQQADLKVDLSSIAQGYSVTRISDVLAQYGIKHYLVEIGGELKTAGYKPDLDPWRIAVERPLPGAQTLQKIISLPKDSPAAVMTSGTYRHYFDANGQRFSHILDARVGRPVTHNLVSVTVIHADSAIADAWSTALLCLGQAEGMKVANAEKIAALFITQQTNQLVESKSDALSAAGNIVIH
ncbi:MAG: FAD:protein FMN transferase [Methylococcales bacterium]